MVARDIDHVEIFAADPRSAVDYLRSALGFVQGAESADATGSAVLLRQGTARLVVASGPRTAPFLAEHGDGVADIALRCDDPLASRDAAIAAGAEPVAAESPHPAVRAFGGVRHTLLPAVPGGAGDAEEPGEAAGVRLLDHVAICLPGGTLSRYADFYTAAFGLVRYSAEYVAIGDQGMDSIVVRSPDGGVTFTLVAPDPARNAGQLDAFLARNGGPGVQHLAFGVGDIIAAVSDSRARGAEFLRTPATYYDMLAGRFPGLSAEIDGLRAAHVLADRDEWGYLLQIFTRSPHARNTLFYEFVQRRGARGFGSANIRALYEAVERDRVVAE